MNAELSRPNGICTYSGLTGILNPIEYLAKMGLISIWCSKYSEPTHLINSIEGVLYSCRMELLAILALGVPLGFFILADASAQLDSLDFACCIPLTEFIS